MAWGKHYKKNAKFTGKYIFKITMSSFRGTHTEIGSEVSIIQRHATVNKER